MIMTTHEMRITEIIAPCSVLGGHRVHVLRGVMSQEDKRSIRLLGAKLWSELTRR